MSYVVTPGQAPSGSSSRAPRAAAASARASEVRDALAHERRGLLELLLRGCDDPAQVDRLRGDRELDRDDARREIEHLAHPARAERRQGGPILDPRLLHRRGQLERHRLREQACFGGDCLRCHAELGEPVLPGSFVGDEAFTQAAEPRAQELQRPLDSRSQRGCECDSEEVERRSERLRVEVPDRDEALLCEHDERVSLVRIELDCDLLLDEAQRVPRAAVQLWHASEREWVLQEASCTGLPELASVEKAAHARRASRRSRRTASLPLPRRAARRHFRGRPRSRVPPRRRASRARPERRRPQARPARSRTRCSPGAQEPRPPPARALPEGRWRASAFWARSACPTVPSDLTVGVSLSFSAFTTATATSGRAP